jgi:5'-deoxynucleotidase YfbR-like HD superfamily hydrolase
MRYSVGMHTHDLVNLLILTWQAAHNGALPRAELIAMAQVHDHPERIFGDMPQPTKVLVGPALQAGELRVEYTIGLHYQLTSEEDEWLTTCDKVELYLWCIEEASRGNVYFMEWVRDYDASFEKNPPHPIFLAVMRAAKANGGQRLKFDLLKQVAGI